MTKQVFFLGLLIRLLAMPFFYHPDLKSQLFHTQYLSRGVFDIYAYVDKNKATLSYPNIFVYLPLTYFFFGTINIILSPFYPISLYSWLNDWGFYQNNYADFFQFMLILKIPYLIFDLLIALLLKKLCPNTKTYLYWLFNPLVIYLVYIMGNFDVIPTALTLICLYYLSKNKPLLGYGSLGLAIALKAYPVMFLPVFLIKFSKNINQVITGSIVSITPIFLSVLPYWFYPAFQKSFFGSGLTQKMLEIKMLSLPVFPIVYLLIIIYFFLKKNVPIERIFLMIFLSFILLVKFHSQWLIWFLPFYTKYLNNKQYQISFFSIFLLCLLYVFLTNDNYLFWGHLTPISWQFRQLSSPYTFITHRFNFPPETIQIYLKITIGIMGLLLFLKPNNENLHHSCRY